MDSFEVNTPDTPQQAPDQPMMNDEGGLEVKQQEDTKTEDRPDWLPEKYNTPEDAMKALDEAQKKITEMGQEKSEGNETPTTDEPPANAEQASEQLAEQGLDMNKYVDLFVSEGKLTDEAYTELADKGFSKELVDGYIDGQVALGNQMTQNIMSIVGGEDEYNGMIEWAEHNLSDAEIEAFDKQLDKGIEAQQLAALGLHTKYKQAMGNDPKLINGDSSADEVTGFQSIYQMTEAMRDKRYDKDPAYRKKVEEMLKKSSF